MIRTDNLEKLLAEFASDVINSAREKLRSDDHVATGRLLDSVTGSRRELSVQFSLEPYWRYVNDGTGPASGRPQGKMPPVDAIVAWCLARGIDPGRNDSTAWAIAKKIQRDGIQGDGFFTDALEEKLGKLQASLPKSLEADVNAALRVMVKEIKS